MKLIQSDNYVIKPTVDALTIPQIAEWFQGDVHIATTKLTYMYHMADFNSQFESYDDALKHSKVCEFILKDKNYEPTVDVKEMIQMYKQMQEDESPTLAVYNSAKDALYKFTAYYNNIDFDERDLKGQLVYKPSEVATSLGKIGALMKTYDDMKERVKKEMFATNKTRGDRSINKFER